MRKTMLILLAMLFLTASGFAMMGCEPEEPIPEEPIEDPNQVEDEMDNILDEDEEEDLDDFLEDEDEENEL